MDNSDKKMAVYLTCILFYSIDYGDPALGANRSAAPSFIATMICEDVKAYE
jgi:hypothetical protein